MGAFPEAYSEQAVDTVLYNPSSIDGGMVVESLRAQVVLASAVAPKSMTL
jgi:hypothetical protein